jgi:flagellar protein FliS
MANASEEYLRNAVMTATPEQLHLMLYEGAIRFTRQGIEGLGSKNLEMAFNGFIRAQKIVLEMLNSLNHEVDRALCNRMAGLYNFIYRKLVEASVQRTPAQAEEALKLLEYQRETWVMLIERLRQERASAVPAARLGPAVAQSADGVESYSTLSVEG